MSYVSKEVKWEAQEITKSGFLQTLHCLVNMGLILGLNISAMQNYFMEHSSVFMQVFQSFATSSRHLRKAYIAGFTKKTMV